MFNSCFYTKSLHLCMSSSSLGYAIGDDGNLLEETHIDFYGDPDDLVPISGPSTRAATARLLQLLMATLHILVQLMLLWNLFPVLIVLPKFCAPLKKPGWQLMPTSLRQLLLEQSAGLKQALTQSKPYLVVVTQGPPLIKVVKTLFQNFLLKLKPMMSVSLNLMTMTTWTRMQRQHTWTPRLWEMLIV